MRRFAVAAAALAALLSTGAMAEDAEVEANADAKGQVILPQGKLDADASASGGASADAAVPPSAEAGGTGAAQTGNASVQPLDEKAAAEGTADATTE